MTADCIFLQTTSLYTFTVIAADDCSGCVLSERQVLNPIMSLLIIDIYMYDETCQKSTARAPKGRGTNMKQAMQTANGRVLRKLNV